MTCREFKHAAASLTLWELSRPGNEILDHADECSQCAGWLDRQQMLAVGMQALQARTAGREAGPHVERALLHVFRQEAFETTQPVVAFRSAPIAFRLSRFFEAGAYVAAAAAIAVGLFLGVRLLEQRSVTGAVRGQAAPVVTAPVQQTQIAANAIQKEIAPTVHERPAVTVKHEVAANPVSQNGSSRNRRTAAASRTSDDPDYVALMFCDPLICSSDVPGGTNRVAGRGNERPRG